MKASRKIAAIIGGGVIGSGWAARFLLNGWDVRLFDPDPLSGQKTDAVLENARYALPMLYDTALPAEGVLTKVNTIAEAVTNANWIQESLPEQLELKHAALAEIEKNAPRDTPIGSSTSGFRPSQLAEAMETPDRLLVARPFDPVYLLPLVELQPSGKTTLAAINLARDILASLGQHPLHLRPEIDALIGDRLAAALWREALWLIKDGSATTQQIDDVIRYGIGLNWAQTGPFETARIAAGVSGMEPFVKQFAPDLKKPDSRQNNAPELADALVKTIAVHSDARSGQRTSRELERKRDENLIGMLRALKARGAGAGALLTKHEKTLWPKINLSSPKPIITLKRSVPIDWTDYNGHMNESRYGQVFSDAADVLMIKVGADAQYIAGGNSYFTVDIQIRFLQETLAAQPFRVASRVLLGQGKKLRLYHEMLSTDGEILATGVQMLIHVSLKTRRACDPLPEILAKLAPLAKAHAAIPLPDHLTP